LPDEGHGLACAARAANEKQVLEEVLASMTQASEQHIAPRVDARSEALERHDVRTDACRPDRHAPCFAQSATVLKT
jgi:hypothetical protein